jgi:hypothetical protein
LTVRTVRQVGDYAVIQFDGSHQVGVKEPASQVSVRLWEALKATG